MIMTNVVDTAVDNRSILGKSASCSTGHLVIDAPAARAGDDEWMTKRALTCGNTQLPTIHSTYNRHHLYISFLYE